MALALSLWTLWSSLIISASYTLDGVNVYEVVRPIRLHDLHKRDLELSRPDVMKYAMNLDGKDIEMHLERNEDLLTQDYTETFYTEDGTPFTTKPDNLDLCYYQGKIVNDSDSQVSVSTCNGLRGYFQTAEQRFLIEPLSDDVNGDHAVLKYDDVNDTPTTCGVTNTTWDENIDIAPHVSKSRARISGPTMFQQQKYNKVFIVADNRMYQKMDSNVDKVRSRIFEIINFVNLVYKPVNTFIALIGLEIWTDSDKITVTPPAGETLNSFTTWRNSVLMKRQNHNNAHLITGIDFEGSTVGLAFIGTLCSDHSTAVIQDHNPRAIAVGATLSHEMGHNLGMNHDTSSCFCPDSTCIMAAALSYVIPQNFSSCSISSLEQYLNDRKPECLLTKPPSKDLLQPAVCGNGFTEIGEECDCGTVTECTNTCCNATTCRLTKGSKCAAGECCQNCKIMDASKICRAKQDVCDLAEYCTGQSSVCPEDVFAVNGLPCKNGNGYCYNGQCPRREDQCIKMWGADAVVGSDYCYEQNKRGTYYAFCLRPTNDQYVACQAQDVRCGKLFCENGQYNPNYGRLVTFSNCKATFYSDRDNDFGQVDTGTKCGDEKVCSQNQCVSLEVAYKATNCSDKCKGHGGQWDQIPYPENKLKRMEKKIQEQKNAPEANMLKVCNHRLECTCEPGWLPPDCELKVGSGLSRDGVIAIVVLVCILLGVNLVGVGIFLMKCMKNRPRRTNEQVQNKNPIPMNSSYKSPQRMNTPQENSPKTIRPKGPPPPPPPKVQIPPKTLHTDFRAAQKALRPPPPPPPKA